MAKKKEPRTKMISATFTDEEYEALERAAKITDRKVAAVVRFAIIKHLRDVGLLPYPGAPITEDEDEEKEG